MMKIARRQILAGVGLGLLAEGANQAIAQDKPGSKSDGSGDIWRAWAVTAGGKTKLVVEGIYSQGGPGLVALVADAVPQGINPKILILDVKLASLPGVWPAVLQPIPASYTKSPYKKGQYESVEIHYANGSKIIVDKIVDAGTGPT